MITKKDLFYTFLAALITGFIGQNLIPMLANDIQFTHWDFSCLIANLDIYPLVIVMMICLANNGPKHVFLRIFIYFVGLCIGYYGWTSGLTICEAVKYSESRLLCNLLSDATDAAEYILLGLLAGVWGYFTIKFESKRALFYFFISPFVIADILAFCFNLFIKIDANIIMAAIDFLCIIGICFLVRKRIKSCNTEQL